MLFSNNDIKNNQVNPLRFPELSQFFSQWYNACAITFEECLPLTNKLYNNAVEFCKSWSSRCADLPKNYPNLIDDYHWQNTKIHIQNIAMENSCEGLRQATANCLMVCATYAPNDHLNQCANYCAEASKYCLPIDAKYPLNSKYTYDSGLYVLAPMLQLLFLGVYLSYLYKLLENSPTANKLSSIMYRTVPGLAIGAITGIEMYKFLLPDITGFSEYNYDDIKFTRTITSFIVAPVAYLTTTISHHALHFMYSDSRSKQKELEYPIKENSISRNKLSSAIYPMI